MSIAENRRARFDYHIEERHEAGMVLEGWEIKAVRAGQVQLTDGYVVIRDGELYLIGCRINALRNASTHVQPEADRTKKLLMHKEEIRRLIGKVEQKGFTLVPLDLHYKGGRVKAEIALAKGKAEHDKRNTEKKRDWEREHGRLMRHKVSSKTQALKEPPVSTPSEALPTRPAGRAARDRRSAASARPALARQHPADRQAARAPAGRGLGATLRRLLHHLDRRPSPARRRRPQGDRRDPARPARGLPAHAALRQPSPARSASAPASSAPRASRGSGSGGW